MERIASGGMIASVECRSRIVDRDRYYWLQEEKGSERGDGKREGEKGGKERRKKPGIPSARFEEQRS